VRGGVVVGLEEGVAGGAEVVLEGEVVMVELGVGVGVAVGLDVGLGVGDKVVVG
jgi:hypothetical protein